MDTRFVFLFLCCGYFASVQSLVQSSPFSTTSTASYVQTTTHDPVRPDFPLYEMLLKNATNNLVKRTLPAFYKLLENIHLSSSCLSSLMKYAIALKQLKVWAITMFDCTAKIPSGALAGTLTEFGAFDECLNIIVHDKRGFETFKGQYCTVEATPRLGPRPKYINLTQSHRTPYNESIMEELRSVILAFYQLTVRSGVCVPSSCSKADIHAVVSEALKPLNFKVRVPQCQVKGPIEVEPIHIIVLFIIFLLVILICAGSWLNWYLSKMELEDKKFYDPSFGQKALLAFSIQANSQKLLSSESRTGGMKCLHGIRALSMTWVILGHTYIWIIFQSLSQPIKARYWLRNIEFEAVLNGWLSVSSFIFLSGLLTTFSTLKFMNASRGRLNVFLYILRRFLRLYPSLLIVLASMFFLPWISTGPFWADLPGKEVEQCRRYWWGNLLFINNLISVDKMCMQHSWYISTDMQLHVFALIILLPLYRSSSVGLIIALGLTLGSSLAVGIITYVNSYDPTILISTANLPLMKKIVEDVHVKAYTYLGPYCVGVVTAYLLLKFPKVNMRNRFKLLGWCLAVILGLSSVYGTHTWNTGNFPPAEVTATYAALHRTAFAVALAWLSYVCISGNSSSVSAFLKFRPFVFMSRLTFMTYLVQGPVIWIRYGSVKERMYFSHYNMLYEYLGNIILSLTVAFVGHILVEAPFSNLERLLLSRAVKIPAEKPSDLCQVRTHVDVIPNNIAPDLKEKIQNT